MSFGYSTSDATIGFLCSCGIGAAALAWYRLYSHPLARFPGPALAALFDYYVAYYDLWMGGGFIKQLEKLHEVYGEIGPNQLHFNDPQAFNEIYGFGTKMTKFSPFYDCFNERESSFGYADPKLAKKRRDVLLPLFSRRSILKLEGVIQKSVDRLVRALGTYAEPEPRPANLHLALHSTTMEIITSYCHANPFRALDAPNFKHPALVSILSTGGVFFLIQHFPFLKPFVFGLPDWLKSPEMIAVERFFNEIAVQVDGILADPASLDHVEHETIYHHLLNTEDGQQPPSRQSLLDEGSVLVAAGSDTVANTCAIGIFHVLRLPDVHSKLVKEIMEAWPEREFHTGVQTLEKLPYLTAVIKESLRFGHGVVSPLPRVVHGDILVGGRLVPAGTVVSMGQTFMHRNPDIFVNPMKFDPERWLSPQSRELDNHLVPFSKGPRMCLGINLAWCELYLIFGNLFRKLSMEVFQTAEQDFDFKAYLTPKYPGHFHVLVNNVPH
ncbi:Trichodiene oxygenase [Leucoagaricus sp. SymC.cos]|nr:Trichodiene oxygenase [Leucoagaricus sp. SymC.cos]